jgi:hypothetical protein
VEHPLAPVESNGTTSADEAVQDYELAYLRKLRQGAERAQKLRQEAQQIAQQAQQEIARREDEATRLEGAHDSYLGHFYETHGLDPNRDYVDTEQGVIRRGKLQEMLASQRERASQRTG